MGGLMNYSKANASATTTRVQESVPCRPPQKPTYVLRQSGPFPAPSMTACPTLLIIRSQHFKMFLFFCFSKVHLDGRALPSQLLLAFLSVFYSFFHQMYIRRHILFSLGHVKESNMLFTLFYAFPAVSFFSF